MIFCKLISESQSVQQLADEIHTVFVKWFDEEMANNYEDYTKMAYLIWANKKKLIYSYRAHKDLFFQTRTSNLIFP